MTDKELNQALEKIQKRFDDVNRLYIRKVAAQIARIGEMNQTSINRLLVMAEVTSDVDEITLELMNAANMTKPEVLAIYNKAMQDPVYKGFSSRFNRSPGSAYADGKPHARDSSPDHACP